MPKSHTRCMVPHRKATVMNAALSNSRSCSWWRTAFVLTLIVLHGAMAISVSPRVGLTFDEPAHLTAGRGYWEHGDFSLQPENGLLPQRLVGLPATLRNTPFPERASANDDVWSLARAYLFAPTTDLPRLLMEARLMVALVSCGLAALVFCWARSLYGERGGLIALVIAVFCPHLLAHAGLTTSDLVAAATFTFATLAWWRLLHRVSWTRVLAAGLAVGALALAKFSAVLFAPVAAVLLTARVLRRSPLIVRWPNGRIRLARRERKVATLLASVVAACIIAWAIIWAAYGWRYSATSDGVDRFQLPWSTVLMEQPTDASHQPGIVQTFVRAARNVRLLPEAYLYGLTYADYFSRMRSAFFAGEYSLTGWRTFFPAVFVLKTTLPLLALLTAGAVILLPKLFRRHGLAYRLFPLMALVLIYGGFAIVSHLNLGHRHLLPIYPALYIMLGAVALNWNAATRCFRVLVLVLLAWHVVDSWRVRPHYLTFFNVLAGGPAGAHRYFVDSSLDWGQGLPDLATWIKQHSKGDVIYLSYFGTDAPERFGIKATRLGDHLFNPARNVTPNPPLNPGLYCMSATMFRRVYSNAKGPWTWEREIVLHHLETRERDATLSLIEQLTLGELRFARLCQYLETRPPTAIVANSILVYRLTEEDLALVSSQAKGMQADGFQQLLKKW